MGLLNLFSKPAPALLGLPFGSFTLDRSGRVVIATLPSSFPAALMVEIGRQVMTTLRDAQAAQLPLAELVVLRQPGPHQEIRPGRRKPVP